MKLMKVISVVIFLSVGRLKLSFPTAVKLLDRPKCESLHLDVLVRFYSNDLLSLQMHPFEIKKARFFSSFFQ